MNITPEEVFAHLDKIAKSCVVENGVIVLKFEDGEWPLDLAQCNSYESILRWQLHLAEKSWITVDLLMAFTVRACEFHRLAVY